MATYSRGKAFAPLADQRWVANALTYLKELDTITTRRSDATSSRETPPGRNADQPNPKKAPKKGARPWKHLPIGYMLAGIYVPKGCLLRGAVTDRKDFYHQALATAEKAATNVLPFSYPIEEFYGTEAYDDLVDSWSGLKGRLEIGDKLNDERDSSHGKRKRKGVLCAPPSHVYPAFKSLLQGDRLGVEVALSGHAALLQQAGLLQPQSRIQGGHPFPCGPHYQGLIIDDFFALAVEPQGSDPAVSEATHTFNAAISNYEKHGILGSAEKDIVGSSHLKVAGAEINSSQQCLSKGIVTVSAPVQKRVSLAVLSLRVANLPVISAALASRLAGNWTSVLLYRRCLTCILKEIYKYGVRSETKPDEVFEFSREAAQELVLASVLSFVAASDITTPFDSSIYATDASLAKGAVVSRPASEKVIKTLWLGGDKKGAYTKLDSSFHSGARICGIDSDDDGLDLSQKLDPTGPSASLYASLQGAPSLLEQPRLSKMAWLSIWRYLLDQCNFTEAVVASCQFGSIH